MSRYSVTVPACVVQQAFFGVDTILPLKEDDVCLHFGYDGPLAVYFLDVEDADDYHEFGYGGRGFVPGDRLTKGQMLDVACILADEIAGRSDGKPTAIEMFRDAIVMDLPV